MKNNSLLWILMCLIISLKLQASIDYGLFFKSHSVLGEERTALVLEENRPYHIKTDFEIAFQMMLRDEPDFGVILHLVANDDRLFQFVFAAGENNKNFPALVFNEGMFAVNVPTERNRWIPVSLHFHVGENKIDLQYDGKDTTMLLPLYGMEEMAVSFGRSIGSSADVAPVNIKDIKITLDGVLNRYWKLGRHDGNSCLDELGKATALASNPLWMIDRHIEWENIYSEKYSGRLDVAFNARMAEFYIVKQNVVTILDGTTGQKKEFPVTGGFPAMEYSGHLVYDTLTSRLFSYSLHDQVSSSFSDSTGRWSLDERHPDESRHYNHARIFNPADSSYYFFGGYGFYEYRNSLFRLNAVTGEITEVEYAPLLEPRYSSAAAIVGDELFVFGGRGNKQGKQEFKSYSYSKLCAINLKTGRSRLLWTNKNPQDNMLMASSMYFDSSDSSFYVVNMNEKAVLWKISMRDSVWTEVSKPIDIGRYQDYDFSFYAVPTLHKFYLVVDKILNDHTHDLSIYSINTPLLDNDEITQEVKSSTFPFYGVLPVLFLLGCGVVIIWFRKKKRTEKQVAVVQEPVLETVEKEMPAVVKTHVETPFFDRDRSAVSLLGTFNVRDKEGNDITSAFTPRLKNLFLLLILSTENDSQGILTKKATSILWAEHEEEAARNNRNVTLRKLRLVLEKVGDVEILNDNGFMRVVWGEHVFCDYRTALDCMRRYKESEAGNHELLDQLLEVLLYGPLLSNTLLDWLDEFKDTYSSASIDLLRNLLDVWRDDWEMVLRITDIIFRHDPLNEEALAAKCSVFYVQGKKGLAKSVYDRFCKEYRESLGEEYKTPLCDLYR